jgi:two-component system, LytTR family, sensor kinase
MIMAAKENINSFLFALFGFGRAKSRAHVLLIVLIHIAGWCLLFLLPVFFYPVRINSNRFVVRELIDKIFLVGFFYLNYYLLIPRFFEKKKSLVYFLLVAACFLVYFSQSVFIRHQYGVFNRASPAVFHIRAPFAETDPMPRGARIFRPPGGPPIIDIDSGSDFMLPAMSIREPVLFGVPRGIVLISLNNTLSSFALLLLMGGFIRLAFSFISNQNEKKALENANLNAEVSFLKSQINPHFLFNTLNGIYSLAHARSPHTEEAILKLSQMLRYVLYDSSTERIELSRDIAYISNFIHLQRLRLAQKVKINYEVRGNTEALFIAPLLLISFIENAFKHGVSYIYPSTISVEIIVFDETLTLVASNTVFENNKFDTGGIGMKNAKRRLDLLYPGKYLLDIVRNNRLYVVNLKINLQSDQLLSN